MDLFETYTAYEPGTIPSADQVAACRTFASRADVRALTNWLLTPPPEGSDFPSNSKRFTTWVTEGYGDAEICRLLHEANSLFNFDEATVQSYNHQMLYRLPADEKTIPTIHNTLASIGVFFDHVVHLLTTKNVREIESDLLLSHDEIVRVVGLSMGLRTWVLENHPPAKIEGERGPGPAEVLSRLTAFEERYTQQGTNTRAEIQRDLGLNDRDVNLILATLHDSIAHEHWDAYWGLNYARLHQGGKRDKMRSKPSKESMADPISLPGYPSSYASPIMDPAGFLEWDEEEQIIHPHLYASDESRGYLGDQ